MVCAVLNSGLFWLISAILVSISLAILKGIASLRRENMDESFDLQNLIRLLLRLYSNGNGGLGSVVQQISSNSLQLVSGSPRGIENWRVDKETAQCVFQGLFRDKFKLSEPSDFPSLQYSKANTWTLKTEKKITAACGLGHSESSVASYRLQRLCIDRPHWDQWCCRVFSLQLLLYPISLNKSTWL